MTIGIDASRANKSNKTGTEWYSWHLIEELKKLPLLSKEGPGVVLEDDRKEGTLITPPNLPLERGGNKFLLYSNSPLEGELGVLPSNLFAKILKWPPKYLWTQIRLWWELWRNPPDVLLVPAHTIPFLPLPKKIKVCVNVHDVGFKRSPELYKPIQVWYHDLTMRRIKQRADVIITISEFSKQEIMDLYGVKPEKIKVVYLGFDAENFAPPAVILSESGNPDESWGSRGNKSQDILDKYKITKPYLLYVGRLEKKKNIARMIVAFALAKEKYEETLPSPPFLKGREEILLPLYEGKVGRGLKLVLAGGAGNQFEEIKKIISDNKLENEVIITGYLVQEDLPIVYNQAEAFLFPTLYEGFGLPILEAMASGVPVITSNQLPHTEVGGDAALYIDPQSTESLADGIIKLLENRELRDAFAAKGLSRVKEFSWQKTAREVYEIIEV